MMTTSRADAPCQATAEEPFRERREPSPAAPAAARQRWQRPALICLLVATGVLYLWGLGASGWANSFYSAAVQAGTKSWKAFFFGSSDAANSITVDKPPASLWVMGISARLFGLNSWSILVPQALEGVAAVGVLYAAVKRWFGAGAGLLAGAVLALTPVGVLMFRFNNPDALLVLLLVCAAYALVRALEAGSTRWLLAAGGLVGFAFLAKSLQAFLVLPAFVLAYLVAGPPKLARRLWQLAAAAGAMVVAGGWWVAIVQLWPTSSRPYIGGSQNNSLWNVIFGYNGFGRITGNETGSVGGGPRAGGGGMWGPTGWTRLFNGEFGGGVAWLIPTALLLGAALLVYTLRRGRTDRTRASVILWGGWLLVTGLTFSLGEGIIHPYYAVALGPAIGVLVGIGGAWFWARRDEVAARVVLAVSVVAGVVTAYALLGRTPDWHPALRVFVLVAGLVAAAGLVIPWSRKVRVAAVSLAVVACLAGPAAYSVATAAQAHSGAMPAAGPAGADGFGPGRFGPGRVGAGGPPGLPPTGGPGRAAGVGIPPGAPGGAPGNGGVAGGPGFGLPAGGGSLGTGDGGSNLAGGEPAASSGGAGGLLQESNPSTSLVKLLEANHARYTWVAATVGSNEASGYQLATRLPVMAIGGFNGSDPSPTLSAFTSLVKSGKIHYFIAGGMGAGPRGGPGGSGSTSSIASWVASHFTGKTVGGATVYDLS